MLADGVKSVVLLNGTTKMKEKKSQRLKRSKGGEAIIKKIVF